MIQEAPVTKITCYTCRFLNVIPSTDSDSLGRRLGILQVRQVILILILIRSGRPWLGIVALLDSNCNWQISNLRILLSILKNA